MRIVVKMKASLTTESFSLLKQVKEDETKTHKDSDKVKLICTSLCLRIQFLLETQSVNNFKIHWKGIQNEAVTHSTQGVCSFVLL